MASHSYDFLYAFPEHPDSIKDKEKLHELQAESGMSVPTLALH